MFDVVLPVAETDATTLGIAESDGKDREAPNLKASAHAADPFKGKIGPQKRQKNRFSMFFAPKQFFDGGSDPPRPLPQPPQRNSAPNDVLASSPPLF